MHATITNEIDVVRSPRVIQIEGMFDVAPSEHATKSWDVDLPIEDDDWQIGLVVGPSGSGKSTVARMFGDALVDPHALDWDDARSVLDGFPESMGTKDVTALLSSVGFSSPPSWLRPFRTLSNGEQFRVGIARALADVEPGGLLVVDEFSSVVDRQVAKVASHTVQKTVRRTGRKFVAVTCHYDVEAWLRPDWIYEPAVCKFTRSEGLQRGRPKLDVEIRKIDGRDWWPLFGPHHYLSANFHPAAHAFLGSIDGEPVAFTSFMHFPHPKARDIKMGHRTVVLPDWQGLGLGNVMAEWQGEWLTARGFRLHVSTTHPAMIAYRTQSPRWIALHRPALRNVRADVASGADLHTRRTRHTQVRGLNQRSFEYVPRSRDAAPRQPAATDG